MKSIITNSNGEKKESILLEVFQTFVIAVLIGKIEVPELTNFYRKKFEEEAKQQEFESFVKH